MRKPKVIVSNVLPSFLQMGGYLEYRPVAAGQGWHWELWAIVPKGEASPVISTKTGDARVFKSADAVLAFHMRYFPKETGVYISVDKPTSTQGMFKK